MPRPDLLDENEIAENLSVLNNWERNGSEINREIVAANFAAAIGAVNSIAVLAESIEHHPNILIYGWNKIRVTTSTHDKGGLTELDFILAKKIEELNI